MFPYLWAISQASIPLIFLFGVLMSGVAYSASNGIWPSFYGEMFSTQVRLSGMGHRDANRVCDGRLCTGHSRRRPGRGPECMGAGGAAQRGDLRRRLDRGLDSTRDLQHSDARPGEPYCRRGTARGSFAPRPFGVGDEHLGRLVYAAQRRETAGSRASRAWAASRIDAFTAPYPW